MKPKRNYLDVLRKFQYPLLITSASVPVVLIAFSYYAPELLNLAWVMPAGYTVMSVLCLLIRGRWRLVVGLVGVLLILGTGSWFMFEATQIFMLVMAAVYGIMLLSSLRIAGLSREEEIPTFWIGTGVIVHVIAQIMVVINQINGNPTLEPVARWMLLAFLLYAVLTMLSMNRWSLAEASMRRQKVPGMMRRKHAVLTLCLFVVALFIALVPAIAEALAAAWNWVAAIIKRFVDWLAELLHSEDSVSGPVEGGFPDMSGMIDDDTVKDSNWENIFVVIIKIALVAAALLLLLFLMHKLWKLLKKLLHDVNRYASEVTGDYQDEVTMTREIGAKEWLRTMRQRLSKVDERGLSSGERIRYRYLRLLVKHPEWSPGSTARENLPDVAAGLYEKARYSTHIITEAEADRFVDRIKRI